MAGLLDAEPIGLQDMLGSARRELAMRRKVYPSWVERRKMKAEEAEREIRVMEAIVAHFEEAIHAGR